MDESSGFQLLLDAASQLEAGTSRVSSFHSAKEDDRLYRSPASSKCQLPIATDRLQKPAQVTAQTKKQLNRMTSSHRYDFENLNIQKLTVFEPVRHRISEHSHARSQNSMNPPKHRASPFSSSDGLTDRSQSRALLYAQKLSRSHPVGRDTSDRSLGRSQDSVNPPKHRASPFSSSDSLTDRSQSRAVLYAQKLSGSHPVGRDTSDRSLGRSQDSVNPPKHRASPFSSSDSLTDRSQSRALLYAEKLSGSHPVGRDTSDRSLDRSQDFGKYHY
ncbi:uncharacterized protein LOC110677159 isoform X3 [Aedes aegypti]|uniref:Uncharacterized protein n=1 Tax=Aedes aegypti TaxID=7159 RepID=A0A6I8U5T6_AEDAE|nr:uncharacterized protein LOC110677159 isoform X3 [Aedes aegypti]